MAARIADIDPTIIVHANRMFYNAETAPDVDLTQFDYVLDCIDTVSAKLLLIRCCKRTGCRSCAVWARPTSWTRRRSAWPTLKNHRGPAGQGHPPRVPQAPSGQGEGRLFGGADPAAAAGGNRGKPPPLRAAMVPASNAFVPAACGLVCGSEVVKDLLRKAGVYRGKNDFSAPRWHKSGAFCMKKIPVCPCVILGNTA